MLLATVKKSTKVLSLKILVKTAVKRNLSEKSDATYTMTIIERNFNGTVYRVTVKEEERLVEEEQPTLEQPRVTEVAAEETGPGAPSGLEAPIVKVKVGLERGFCFSAGTRREARARWFRSKMGMISDS